MPFSLLQRLSGGVWNNESGLIELTITDTLHFPKMLEATVANFNNSNQHRSAEENYVNYTQVRVLERNTNNITFYGRVEDTKASYDPTYGQTIKIIARDNLQELLKRQLDNNYTGFLTRSKLIQGIIDGRNNADASNTFPRHIFNTTSIGLGSTTPEKITASPTAITNAEQNFKGAGKNALRAISELADGDPRTVASSSLKGFDFFLDHEFDNVNIGDSQASNATPDLHYFSRMSRPAGGANSNGLIIRYAATEADRIRSMMPDYNINTKPEELITRVRVEYVDTGDTPVTRHALLINHGAVTGAFQVNPPEYIRWDGGIDRATIQHIVGTATIGGETIGSLLITNISDTDASVINLLHPISGLVITGATSGATATVRPASGIYPGSLREVINQDVEVLVKAYHTEDTPKLYQDIAAMLHYGGDTVQRGSCTIIRYPYYRISGTHTGGVHASILTDASAGFLNSGVYPGDIVRNISDNIRGLITSVDSATQLTVSAGGMSWDNGNQYEIYLMVRAGHVIRIDTTTNSADQNQINQDVLVTQITYTEGYGQQHSKIEFLFHDNGRGTPLPPQFIRNITEALESRNYQSVGVLETAPLAFQVTRVSSVFTASNQTDVTWTAGSATFADGRSQSISTNYSLNGGASTPEPFTIPNTNLHYVYIEDGNNVLQITDTFANSVGNTL